MLVTFGFAGCESITRLGLRLVMGRFKCHRRQRGMCPRLSAARPARSRARPRWSPACPALVRACPPFVRADGLSSVCRPPGRTAGGGRTAADELRTDRPPHTGQSRDGARRSLVQQRRLRRKSCPVRLIIGASCTRAALAPNRRRETGIGSPLEPAVIDQSTAEEISKSVSVAETLCTRSSITWLLLIGDLNCLVLNDTVRHG